MASYFFIRQNEIDKFGFIFLLLAIYRSFLTLLITFDHKLNISAENIVVLKKKL